MRWFTIGEETAPQADEGSGFFFFEGERSVGAGATVTRDTAVKRSGAAARAHNSGGSGALAYTRTFWGLQGANGYYVRIYFRVDALPTTDARVLMLSDNAADLVAARLTVSGKIQLRNEVAGTQIGANSTLTVAPGVWYRLELYCKVVAGANDACELRIAEDGQPYETVGQASGLALSESQVTQAYRGWSSSPGVSKTIWTDDVAVNDDTTAADNSWPGDGRVVYLEPAADNARGANWVAGAGGTANLFDALDNDPPSGLAAGAATDTSQIKNANTGDTTGNYDVDLDTYQAAGLGAFDTITLVQAVMQVGITAAGVVSAAMRVLANPVQAAEQAKNAGDGAAISTYGINWHTIWGAAQDQPAVVLGSPATLRIGRRGAQAAELHCCGIRLAVEYTTSAPPPPPPPPVTSSGRRHHGPRRR